MLEKYLNFFTASHIDNRVNIDLKARSVGLVLLSQFLSIIAFACAFFARNKDTNECFIAIVGALMYLIAAPLSCKYGGLKSGTNVLCLTINVVIIILYSDLENSLGYSLYTLCPTIIYSSIVG